MIHISYKTIYLAGAGDTSVDAAAAELLADGAAAQETLVPQLRLHLVRAVAAEDVRALAAEEEEEVEVEEEEEEEEKEEENRHIVL